VTLLGKNPGSDPRNESGIALLQIGSNGYEQLDVPDWVDALGRGAQILNWHSSGTGPFGRLIRPGSRVVVKPNLVLHQNGGPWGLDPLVTHPKLIQAVVDCALMAGPSQVLVGDAPIQGCNFSSLLDQTGLSVWESELRARNHTFQGIRDFRRTTCVYVDGVRIASENVVDESEFRLFDLGSSSLLEPITSDDSFRVTCYDPRELAKTHHKGRHQYLIAKPILDADVIINVPKLKMHKKAGITCALKNMVGINGNKEYLPHHRIGGSSSRGDCYPGNGLIKRALEYVLDRQNMTKSAAEASHWGAMARTLTRVLSASGDRVGVEGAWSGNDTVWRMTLDLNRILLYGRSDGTMADEPQRQLINIADSVMAGQGDGPLSPQPLPLQTVMMGLNSAAMDWVGCALLGFNPHLVPLAQAAFGVEPWPLTHFDSGAVEIVGDWGVGDPLKQITFSQAKAARVFPAGWLDAAAGTSTNHRTAQEQGASLSE
jgi:uncharacterized protein (DUF362 family)